MTGQTEFVLISADGRHLRVTICLECFCVVLAEGIEQHQQRCKIKETTQ
jgi:hypothetical protein